MFWGNGTVFDTDCRDGYTTVCRCENVQNCVPRKGEFYIHKLHVNNLDLRKRRNKEPVRARRAPRCEARPGVSVQEVRKSRGEAESVSSTHEGMSHKVAVSGKTKEMTGRRGQASPGGRGSAL